MELKFSLTCSSKKGRGNQIQVRRKGEQGSKLFVFMYQKKGAG